MQTYPIPMVPGPVRVPDEIRDTYKTDYGSGDLEPEFFDLYAETEINLRQIVGTEGSVVVQTGEGMIGLWGALKSCLVPGDKVLAVSTGLFGSGIGDMARSIGADVKTIELGIDKTIAHMAEIENAITDFNPKMITVVHCETPSGTLNPLTGLGRLKKEHSVPLLYVDAVSSVGGTPVLADKRHIDLCLGGAQKCFSAPPGTAFLSVSDTAWEIIDQIDYVGYDALKPFRNAQKERFFPYTPDWYGVAALNAGAKLILGEGLTKCFNRHQEVAAYCRKRIVEMGLTLFPDPDAVPSPTVTAVKVPDKIAWETLDSKLRNYGLVLGGNLGPLKGKVFRVGHMGSQADLNLVTQALDVLETVVKDTVTSVKTRYPDSSKLLK